MTPLESITQKVLEQIHGPELVRVKKSFTQKEAGGYCFDGAVLIPETLEETDEILKDISITPIWAGVSGQGIFCPPEKDQIAVVSFLHFNRAFPVFTGIWGDNYKPAEGAPGQFILADGKGGIFKMNGAGLFSIINNSKSLKTLLEGIVDGIINLKTVGTAAAQATDPSTITLLTKLKGEISLLLKE